MDDAALFGEVYDDKPRRKYRRREREIDPCEPQIDDDALAEDLGVADGEEGS